MRTGTGTDQIWVREEGKHKTQRTQVWHMACFRCVVLILLCCGLFLLCCPNFIVFRVQARKAQGPIDFVRIHFIFYLKFFIDYPGIFGGLNMVKNSWKFAHTLEPAAVRTPLRLGPGCGTEALRRPLEHHQKTWCVAHTYLHVFIWKSVQI